MAIFQTAALHSFSRPTLFIYTNCGLLAKDANSVDPFHPGCMSVTPCPLCCTLFTTTFHGTSITVYAFQINQILLQCNSPLPKTRCKHGPSPLTAGICCSLTLPHVAVQVIMGVPCSDTVPHYHCRLIILWACGWLQSETLVDEDLPQSVSSSMLIINHAHCFIQRQ